MPFEIFNTDTITSGTFRLDGPTQGATVRLFPCQKKIMFIDLKKIRYFSITRSILHKPRII